MTTSRSHTKAFALVMLLIMSGETQEIFKAICGHKDEHVRFALLHVLKVSKDERAFAELITAKQDGTFPPDVADRIRETIGSLDEIPA